MRNVYLELLLVACLVSVGACRPAIDDNAPDPVTASSSTPGDGSITTAMLADGAVTPVKLSQAYLPLAGGTMSGALVLSSDPSVALGAVTKQYADGYLGGQSIYGMSSITNGQTLTWNSASSRWQPASASGSDAIAIGAGGQSVDTAASTTTAPTSNYVLMYNPSTASVANKWAAGQIVAGSIATDAVTSAKILDGTIAPADLAADSVTTVKILDANVTTAKILDSNVTTAKIADANVTTAKIADANVTLAKLVAGTEGQTLQNIGTMPSWVSTKSAMDLDNLTVSASVAGSALTLSLKTAAATNATATDRIGISFRNATAATGTFTKEFITAALSITVPSGCKLGHSNAADGYLYLYALDNSGTVELAVSGHRIFDETSLQSTTAIGGGACTTSASTLYSDTARASVPIRMIARIKSNQVAVGTWASAPIEISLGPQAKRTGPFTYLTCSYSNAGVCTSAAWEVGTWAAGNCTDELGSTSQDIPNNYSACFCAMTGENTANYGNLFSCSKASAQIWINTAGSPCSFSAAYLCW